MFVCSCFKTLANEVHFSLERHYIWFKGIRRLFVFRPKMNIRNIELSSVLYNVEFFFITAVADLQHEWSKEKCLDCRMTLQSIGEMTGSFFLDGT